MSRRVIFAGLLVVLAAALAFSGRLLVLDAPEKSQVIVVLAGDENDRRFRRGVELLKQGYGEHLLLDARADVTLYVHTPAELAAPFLQQHAGELSQRVAVCPIYGDSTDAESTSVAKCLALLHPSSVLVVTSDAHTRRALSVFRKRVPQYHWSVAAASDSTIYGEPWWTRRAWAKMWLIEMQRFVWWEAVDRWR